MSRFAFVTGCLVSLCSVVSLSTAFAEPPAAPAPASSSPAAKLSSAAPDFHALLRSGQAHSNAKEWPSAISDLRAALKVKPDDGAALSELSYCLLMTKQLVEARTVAERATKRAQGVALIAASYYNLGRIAEEQADQEAASEAYSSSLLYRENDEVAKRLLMLDEFATAVLCHSPRPLESICDCFKKMPGGRCEINEEPGLPDEARVITASWDMLTPATGQESRFLALHFADGWSVVNNLGRDRDVSPIYWYTDNFNVKLHKIKGERVVELRYTRSEENTRCQQLSGQSMHIKGLRHQVVASCAMETQHVNVCRIDEQEHSLQSCSSGIVSCKYTQDARDESELDQAPAKIRGQVLSYLRKGTHRSKAKLTLTPDGKITGTSIEESPDNESCPKPQPFSKSIF